MAEYDAAERRRAGRDPAPGGLVLLAHHRVARPPRTPAPGRGLGGRAGGGKDPRDAQIEALTARAAKAEAELARTQAALDIMGKAHALLETLSESADTPPRSSR